MGKKSRDKGYRGERALAAEVGGQRTSRTGERAPDVTAGDEYGNEPFEVKTRRKSFTTLYDAITQGEAVGARFVAVKDDYKPWLVVMTLDTWRDLFGAAKNSGG